MSSVIDRFIVDLDEQIHACLGGGNVGGFPCGVVFVLIPLLP